MKFGVSTWLWTSPFDGDSIFLFEKIKEMGFDTIEIPVEDPQLIEISKLKEFQKIFDLNVTVCGAFGPGRDLTHNDPLVVHTCMNYIKDCLDIFPSSPTKKEHTSFFIFGNFTIFILLKRCIF